MKDAGFLLISATLLAAIAWAFWHFAGENSYEVIATVALVAVIADNIRLRRLLRSLRRH